MNMTAKAMTGFFAGIVSVIAAVGTLIVSLDNGRVLREEAIKKDIKLQEIHVLVNSRLSAALEEIAALRQYIMLEGKSKTAGIVAIEKAKK